jgi:hypothetical protein
MNNQEKVIELKKIEIAFETVCNSVDEMQDGFQAVSLYSGVDICKVKNAYEFDNHHEFCEYKEAAKIAIMKDRPQDKENGITTVETHVPAKIGEIKLVVLETTWLGEHGMYGIDFGWGNGYIVVPANHPAYGKSYHDDMFDDIDVHGGITLSEHLKDVAALHKSDYNGEDGWVFGFDTAHNMDSLGRWPKELVEKETSHLAEQFAKL